MNTNLWSSAARLGALIVLVGLVAVWIVVLRPVALGGSASYVFVEGTSMEPELSWGDLAIVRQGSYEVGDVVAFRVPESDDEEGQLVIHRIVEGDEQSGFETKGDNTERSDLWETRPDDIIGELWLNVPGGADWLNILTAPVPLSALAGALALTLMSGEPAKKRRRGGRRMRQQHKTTNGGGRLPLDTKWVSWLFGLGLLAVGLIAVAVFAFMQPTQETAFEERLAIDHTMAFEYTVETESSELYPDGVVGPVSADSVAEGEARVTPIFTQLAEQMEIGVEYAAQGVDPEGLAGELSADLEIRAEDGWVQTRELLAPTSFAGSEASAEMEIDLQEIASFIRAAEEETDFIANTYTVSVIPTVELQGEVGSETIDETYSAPFPINFGHTQIVPSDQLASADVSQIGATVASTKTASLLGIPFPILALRWMALGGVVLVLGALAAVVALAYRQLAQDEVAMIQFRYRSLLVAVDAIDRPTERRIRVASMQDLVRIAQRDGRMILYQQNGAPSHCYFIDDGTVTYEYTAKSVKQEQQGAKLAEARAT